MHRKASLLSSIRKVVACLSIFTICLAGCPTAPVFAQETTTDERILKAAANQQSQPDVPARKGSTELVKIVPKVVFSSSPTDLEIQTARVFTEPLIPMSGSSSASENQLLSQKLLAFKAKKNLEDLSDLSQFLATYPNSKWRPSLELCMGVLSRETGFTSNAITHFRSAWDRAKNETGEQQKNVANKAFGEYMMMLTRLGRVEELQTRLASVKGRAFHGAQEAHVTTAKDALGCLKFKPEMAFRCGPFALNAIINKDRKIPKHNTSLTKYKTSKNGTNLAELSDLAAKVGLKYQAAKRTPGSAFIVPAVVHWKTNHFSAITRKVKDRFKIKDPTFDYAGNSLVTSKALEAESDGYFLVPAGPLPAGWTKVSRADAAKIWGKGGSHDRVPPGPEQHETCTECCQRSPRHMPKANAYTMQATLHIQDIPVAYSAPIGPSMDFLLNYNHLEQGQPANFTFSNVGPDWSLNWLSSLTIDASGNASLSASGGGFEFYPYVQPDNVNNPYAPNLISQAILSVSLANNSYTRALPDGSLEVYGQPDGTGRYFMTQVVDPQGNATIIQYNSNFRVTSITDPIGQSSTLTYVSNTLGDPNYYKVAQISDPFSRTASITYDTTSTSVSSITDANSLKSDFTYDSTSSFINLMTTPYGSTLFERYTLETSTDILNGLRTQLPDGSANVIENWMRDKDNTYYWDREQLALYPNEPGHTDNPNFDTLHCTKYQFMIMEGGNDEAPVMLWSKDPLESKVDFTYEGQSGGFVGISNKPITISRQVETSGGGTATQTYQNQYNSFGRVTQSIDPLGRTFQYKYAANNIDLLEVRQTRNGANDLIGKWVYNNQHRPTSYIDGSGQKTTYGYNSKGQLTTTVDAAGNTTTMSYDANFRLTQIDGPMSGTADKTTFTWFGFGQVQTVTDSTGYALAFQYDAMNRPTLTTYPDTTTEKTVYDKLDAVLTKDRNDRWTERKYDSLDQLVAEIDPLGRKTQYTWCFCGSLATLTDGNNNTTTWHHDLQGRVTQKVYANSTDVDYVYQPLSGRLSTRTDALNQITGYSYNLDNTLSGVAYTNEVNPTSDVSLSYDPDYQRTLSVQNGWGTNSYQYNPYIVDPFKAAHFWISGKPTVGDLVNVTVTNASLSGGKRNVQYAVVSGDTSQSILTGHVKDAINADSALNTANIKAAATDVYVAISAPSTIGAVTVKTSTNGPVTETIGGTVTVGDVVSIKAVDTALPSGQKTKSYTVLSGDNLAAIATALKNAINADTDFQAAGITASSTSAVVTITSTSANSSTFSGSVNAGGTETITQRGGPGEMAAAGGGGRLNRVTNSVIANSDISYSYDNLGRTKTRAIDGASNSINWSYDEMSRVTSEANLLGTFQYNYVDNTPGSSKGVSRLASINYPNNQITNFDWYGNNGDERLKQIQNLGPTGNVLSQFNYRYNPAGEITQWPQIQNGQSRFQSLGYDLAGQLTSSQISDAQPSNKYLNQDYYAYDPGANRTGNQTAQVQNIKVGGSVTAGDVLTVTVKDSGLSGGQQAVNYTIQSGDSLSTIAANLAANITLESSLQTLGVNATSSSGIISLKSVSPNITTYAGSSSGGATATLTVGTTNNFIENATIALKPGQSITTGDVLTLTVRDTALPGGLQNVSYTVAGGNTLTNIATGLKNALNANSNLSGQGITATSAGATVTVKSTSSNPTVYNDTTVATAKEYIDLNVCPNKTETIGISGTKTTSDVMTVVFLDAGLGGGVKTISYSVQAGDNLTSIATGISNAINADTGLQGIGVSSISSGQIVSISNNSPNVTTIRTSTNANATEILKQGLPHNGTQTAVIGGTKTTGDVLTITVYDAGLAGGSKAINYSVVGGDTLPTMTTGLANAINADTALQAIGVSATAVSTVLNIKSISQNSTTYTSSLSGGATATIALARTAGAQLSAYNNVNELTSIAAGGPVRFQASTNKALKTASVNSNPATLVSTKNFVRDESLSSGANAASVAATDGANNTKTNTYQVNVNPVSTQNLTYDANGNMTSDGTNTYKWDAENRLIQIDYPGSGNKSEFVFDPLARNSKIIETESGNITSIIEFIWSGTVRVEGHFPLAMQTKAYFGRGETNIGEDFYYTSDQQGSVAELSDRSGTILSQFSFDPWGQRTVIKFSRSCTVQYAAYFLHERSTLYLTLFRAYNPKFGRWLSRDPIEEAANVNLFNYVGNSPIGGSDPSGLGEFYFVGSPSFFKKMKSIVDKLRLCPNMKPIFENIKRGKYDVVFEYAGDDNNGRPKTGNLNVTHPPDKSGDIVVTIQPFQTGQSQDGVLFPPEVATAHELGHVDDFEAGHLPDPNVTNAQGDPVCESKCMEFENWVRDYLKVKSKPRTRYYGPPFKYSLSN